MQASTRTRRYDPSATGLAVAGAVVAALTLLPAGTGWAWASPTEELHWYATGLDSTSTLLQLVGNLGLLTAPAVLAVLRWPGLARPIPLMAAALATGAGIELLQWALPLGRVVSPLDALLNAAGAVVAGLLVAGLAHRVPMPGGLAAPDRATARLGAPR